MYCLKCPLQPLPATVSAWWSSSDHTRLSPAQVSLTGWSLCWTFSLQLKIWRFAPGFSKKSVLKEMRERSPPWPPISTEIIKWVFIPTYLWVKLGRNSRSRPTLWTAQWRKELCFQKTEVGNRHACSAEATKLVYIILLRGYIMLLPVFSCGSQRAPMQDLRGQMSEVFFEYSCAWAPGAPFCPHRKIPIITGLVITT